MEWIFLLVFLTPSLNGKNLLPNPCKAPVCPRACVCLFILVFYPYCTCLHACESTDPAMSVCMCLCEPTFVKICILHCSYACACACACVSVCVHVNAHKHLHMYAHVRHVGECQNQHAVSSFYKDGLYFHSCFVEIMYV